MTVRTIDHYTDLESEHDRPLYEREDIALRMLGSRLRPGMLVLDAGCGDATFLVALRAAIPGLELHGVDFSADRLSQSRTAGLHLRRHDLHDALPYEDGFFDAVYAGEVLEHLFDPDSFLEDLARVLRPNGVLVLSTPNMCAWYNRALFAVGMQPLFMEASTRDATIGAGWLKRWKKQERPVGHVRLFTGDALTDLITARGFRVDALEAAPFERFPGALLTVDWFAGRLRASLGSNFVCLATRT